MSKWQLLSRTPKFLLNRGFNHSGRKDFVEEKYLPSKIVDFPFGNWYVIFFLIDETRREVIILVSEKIVIFKYEFIHFLRSKRKIRFLLSYIIIRILYVSVYVCEATACCLTTFWYRDTKKWELHKHHILHEILIKTFSDIRQELINVSRDIL